MDQTTSSEHLSKIMENMKNLVGMAVFSPDVDMSLGPALKCEEALNNTTNFLSKIPKINTTNYTEALDDSRTCKEMLSDINELRVT